MCGWCRPLYRLRCAQDLWTQVVDGSGQPLRLPTTPTETCITPPLVQMLCTAVHNFIHNLPLRGGEEPRRCRWEGLYGQRRAPLRGFVAAQHYLGNRAGI